MKNKVFFRDIQSDLIRVVAMLCVIFVHMPPDGVEQFYTLLSLVFLSCNGLFFMLSGKYNLNFCGTSGKEYLNYYIKRGISVLVPLFVYSFIIFLYSNYLLIPQKGIVSFWNAFIRFFLVENASTHVWFVYSLIGMLLGAPFLSKMLRNLSEFELKLLIIIGFLWELFSVVIVQYFMGLTFTFGGWFMTSWVFYFILGYSVDRLVKEKNLKLLYLLGVGSLIVTVVQYKYIPQFRSNITDLSPVYTIVVISIYLFLQHICIIRNGTIKWLISVFAKYSFGIYFIHPTVIAEVRKVISTNLTDSSVVIFILRFAVTLIISFALAVGVDTLLIKPLKSKRLN